MTEKELGDCIHVLHFNSMLCWELLLQRTWLSRILYPGSEKTFTILATKKRAKTLKESLPTPKS